MTLQKLKREVAKFGGRVDVDSDGDQVTIQISAPDGMQWADGQCLNMVDEYWKHAPETKDDVLESLFKRISFGIEPIDHNIN